MDEKPLISVVLPTYNEEHYVGSLLSSIEQQTYQNYEIIAIDSFSADRTKEILEGHKARIISVPKTNISAARNAGISAAKGEILAFIDADYILTKDVFAKVVETFLDDKDSRIVCIEPRNKTSLKDLKRKDRIKFKTLNFFISGYKWISFFTPLPAAYGCDFCRKDTVDRVGPFNKNIDVAEDKEFFSRLKKYGKFKILNQTVRMSYRRHAKDGTVKTGFLYFLASVSAIFTKRFKFRFKSIRRGKHVKKP